MTPGGPGGYPDGMTPVIPLMLSLLAGQSPSFEATGEIIIPGASSAAWDGERIVGPRVNLTAREGGGWAGDILSQSVDLAVDGGKVSGPNFELFVEFDKAKGKGSLRGTVFGRRFSLEYGSKEFTGRVGSCSYDLTRQKIGGYTGQVACGRSGTLPNVARLQVKLIGEAEAPVPPMPQFALALVSVLPG